MTRSNLVEPLTEKKMSPDRKNVNHEAQTKKKDIKQKIRSGWYYIVDAVTSSGILKAKQKLGVTFSSDALGGIDFTKFSNLSMCSVGAGRCWLVQWPGLPPRHCT